MPTTINEPHNGAPRPCKRQRLGPEYPALQSRCLISDKQTENNIHGSDEPPTFKAGVVLDLNSWDYTQLSDISSHNNRGYDVGARTTGNRCAMSESVPNVQEGGRLIKDATSFMRSSRSDLVVGHEECYSCIPPAEHLQQTHCQRYDESQRASQTVSENKRECLGLVSESS